MKLRHQSSIWKKKVGDSVGCWQVKRATAEGLEVKENRPGGSLGVCLFNFIGTIPVNLEHCLSLSTDSTADSIQ